MGWEAIRGLSSSNASNTVHAPCCSCSQPLLARLRMSWRRSNSVSCPRVQMLSGALHGKKPKVATRHFAKHALPELNLIGSEEAEDRHLDHTVNSRIPGRTVEIKQHGLVRQGQTRLDELGRGDFAIVRFERTRSDLIF